MKVITIDADRFFRHQKGKSNQSWSKRVTFSFRFVPPLLGDKASLVFLSLEIYSQNCLDLESLDRAELIDFALKFLHESCSFLTVHRSHEIGKHEVVNKIVYTRQSAERFAN